MSLILPVTLVLALAGCDRAQPPQPRRVEPARKPPPAQTNFQAYLDHAQPKLPTVRLWIGSKEILSEVAVTQTEVATGMMHRESIGDNEGMLFIFGQPHRASFYMRNTKVPLSAAYIGADGSLLEIHDLKPLDETPVTASSDKVQFVLETKQGWFEKNNIIPGTIIRTELGSLRETFLQRTPIDR